jgi:hypothetical protein
MLVSGISTPQASLLQPWRPLAADGPLCLLFFARERAVSCQHILELHNQVSYKPLSQRVVGLGCKKPQPIKPTMNIFRRGSSKSLSREYKVRRRNKPNSASSQFCN